MAKQKISSWDSQIITDKEANRNAANTVEGDYFLTADSGQLIATDFKKTSFNVQCFCLLLYCLKHLSSNKQDLRMIEITPAFLQNRN
jgi:hypothetical protein